MKQGRVIPITEEAALKAAQISLRFKLPLADSLVYATAQIEGAVVWTQDEHFKGLRGVNYKKPAIAAAT